MGVEAEGSKQGREEAPLRALDFVYRTPLGSDLLKQPVSAVACMGLNDMCIRFELAFQTPYQLVMRRGGAPRHRECLGGIKCKAGC